MGALAAFLKRLLIPLLYTAVTYGSLVLTFAVARWTRIETLPVFAALLVSLPVLILRGAHVYSGPYEDVPGVTWVILSMLLGAGLMLLGSILLV